MRAFLAFTSFKSHAWRGSPCWHHRPSLTTRASQQKTCLFHPAAGESHPSRLQAAISSQVTASASRPPNFTFPSLPVRQWVLISHRTPIGRRREPPGQTTLPFPPHGRRDLPIQTASIFLLSDVGESLPATHLTLLCLYLSNAASLDLRLDAGKVLPARQSYYSVFTCPTQQVLVSRWTPARCSRPENLTFPVFTCPTKQVLVSHWTPARCSRPDKSYFSCLYLSNTASLNLLLDAGEVLPARQTLFRLLAPKISNPVERDIPGRFGKLSLQSTTGEAPPPSSQVSISPQMPQEPPGWTTSPFPPSSAKLAHQLDVG